ncbi:MAG: hypothetical protein LUI05_09170 [Oscillospiraceae bacterium]|nr:hypothetical protein [Oscillospiraceae bacterium]
MDSNIIQSILEIDRSAKEKLAAAEEQKNKIVADAEKEKKRIIDDKIKSAGNALKHLEESEKSKADEKMSEISAEREKEIERLNKIYDARHEEWEDNILRSVIGG